MKLKPVWVDINPKAVTTYELYGFINPATREWKDGQYYLHRLSIVIIMHVCSLIQTFFAKVLAIHVYQCYASNSSYLACSYM